MAMTESRHSNCCIVIPHWSGLLTRSGLLSSVQNNAQYDSSKHQQVLTKGYRRAPGILSALNLLYLYSQWKCDVLSNFYVVWIFHSLVRYIHGNFCLNLPIILGNVNERKCKWVFFWSQHTLWTVLKHYWNEINYEFMQFPLCNLIQPVLTLLSFEQYCIYAQSCNAPPFKF